MREYSNTDLNLNLIQILNLQVPVQLIFVEFFLVMFWGLFPSVLEEEVSLFEGRYYDFVSASGFEPELSCLLQTSTVVLRDFFFVLQSHCNPCKFLFN